MDWQIGDEIENRYEIHDIKQGGFGIVYICYDHEFKSPVAIKTFQAKFLSSQKAIDDFTNEALTWIRLDKHKNIVKAHYVKNIEGQPYILLEYVAGGNLDDWLYTKQLDLPLALNFALQFCTGMDYAFQKMGLIHRDIKPSNILLTKDKTVKITDFGLSKSIERETKSEQTLVPSDISYVQSSIAGTPPYMAPEQFIGENIDTRTDIYSFGIVMYQMITGSFPYSRKSSWKEMHSRGAPLPIKQDIPAELDILIHTCLKKDPAKRYQNFSELRQALSELYIDLTGETIPEESGEYLEVWELVNKGAALSELGRADEAIVCYDMALDINPRFDGAWSNKGYALAELGYAEEAIICCNTALDINPQNDWTWGNKGYVLAEMGHASEAIVCYDKALDINLQNDKVWSNKGNVLGRLGRTDEAIVCYDKALDINPRDEKTWYNKGFMLSELGRTDEAIFAFEKFIEFAPPEYASYVKKIKEFILQLKGRI